MGILIVVSIKQKSNIKYQNLYQVTMLGPIVITITAYKTFLYTYSWRITTGTCGMQVRNDGWMIQHETIDEKNTRKKLERDHYAVLMHRGLIERSSTW